MAAKLSSRFKSYLVATISQMLRVQNPPAWAKNTLYSLNSQVTSNGNIYAATKSGSSGSTPPTAGSGTIQDGSVTWLYIGKALDQSDINSNLYMGLGRRQPWSDENAPPDAVLDEDETARTLRDLVTLLRLTPSNTRLGLKKNEWVSGTVYHAYTGTESDTLNQDLLYITSDSENIFKCIDNNHGAPSTVRPNARQQGLLVLSDGYVWKYMGSVSNVDLGTFGTNEYLPIQAQALDGTDQGLVQTAARPGEISSFIAPYTRTRLNPTDEITTPKVKFVTKGNVSPTTEASASVTIVGDSVEHIFVTNSGSGYPLETYAVVLEASEVEPSEKGKAEAVIDAGTVSSVQLINASSGYTNQAVAFIIGDGTGAKIKPTFDSDNKLASINVEDGGSGYTWAEVVIVPGSIAWHAKAILGPSSGHGRNMATELGADTLLISVNVSSALKPYVAETEFRQVSLLSSVRAATNSQSNALMYMGPAHPDINATTSENLNKYAENTGHLLYLNNIPVVNHQQGQEETIKIAISF